MRVIICLVIIFLYSCSKKNVHEEYYSDGNLKIRVQTNDEGVYNGIFEEFYEDGTLKGQTKFKNGVMVDTVFTYHKNGKLKAKGLLKSFEAIGWWSHYNLEGCLIKREERIIVNNTPFLNQIIEYYPNGKINYDKSSFFTLFLDDTLSLGANKGELYYPPDTIGFESRFTRIIIENPRPNGLIVKDTFGGAEDTNWFGIYTDKSGNKIISGKIEHEIIFINKIGNDSAKMSVHTTEKYFEKEVYVR